MIKAALLLSCALCVSAIDIKTYAGSASQADEGTSGYTYCDVTSGDITAVTSTEQAEITVSVAGVTGDCEKLEPTMTDAEFEDRFNLQTRVYFTVDVDDSGDLVFKQYGDEDCAYVQRSVNVQWDADGNTCTDGGVSPGMLAEYYFTDSNCSDYTSADLITAFANDNVEVQNMVDPYPTFTAYVNNSAYNWTTNPDKKIRFNTFISDGTIYPHSYCYGIGEKQTLPYGYPTVANGTYYHDIYTPIPGALCGLPCRQHFIDAMAASAAQYGQFLFVLSNPSSTDELIASATQEFMTAVEAVFNQSQSGVACHTLYQLGGDGLSLFGFIYELAVGGTCNECQTVSWNPAEPSYNTLTGVYFATATALAADPATADIGSAMSASVPSSRMGVCLTSMATTWIHMETNTITTLSSSDENSRVIELSVPVDGLECANLTDSVLTTIASSIATAVSAELPKPLPAANVQVSKPSSCNSKTELVLTVEVLAPKSHTDNVETYPALKSTLSPLVAAAISGETGATLINTAVGGDANVTVDVASDTTTDDDTGGDDTTGDDNTTDGDNNSTSSGSNAISMSVFALVAGVVAMLG